MKKKLFKELLQGKGKNFLVDKEGKPLVQEQVWHTEYHVSHTLPNPMYKEPTPGASTGFTILCQSQIIQLRYWKYIPIVDLKLMLTKYKPSRVVPFTNGNEVGLDLVCTK